MRTRLLALVGVTVVCSLAAAQSAAAATEVGNKCVGNTSAENLTVIGLANGPSSTIPATIPANGVITRWTFNIVPIPSGILTQTLKVFRPTGALKQFQVIGESAPAPISTGLNTFPTRIPVHAGDLIGTSGAASGEALTVFCETADPGDRVGAFAGNPTLGSTATIAEEGTEVQAPIVVFVEPDADNDGFGDETQDQCPQSAATQSPCPPVTLSTSTQVKKGSVVVVVTASTAAPVSVKGVAKLGKGKKANLNGGTKNLTPGVLGKFTLKFTKKLKTKLAGLSRKKSLQLKVTVAGTSVAGQVTTKTLNVKLKGQAKG